MATSEFEYSQEQLKTIANKILDHTLDRGATAAQIELNESIITSVNVLNQEIENFETSYDQTLTLNVYLGNKRGVIGITSTNPNNLDQIITQAIEIAKYTQEDFANSIADKEYICNTIKHELQLYQPITISNQDLIDRTKNIENLGLAVDTRITSSDGASLNLVKHNFVIASTNGLNLGYKTTRYSNGLSLIGNTKDGMQNDYWYSNSRGYNELDSDKTIANIAASRVLRRLTKGTIKAGKYPVIFESQVAKSIFQNFISAISGQNIYRKLSFLNDSLDTKIFPEWINIYEDPFIIKGLASCYFDTEGVKVQKRTIVQNGVVMGYILSSYSARKLNMQPTGNSGGTHNLFISNNITGDITSLAKEIGMGLIVIETIGHGLNMVTGDYSVGASGLYVENGQIKHFVDNITISGNMREIFNNIKYISDDIQGNSSINCGSMVVDGITVSN